MQPGDLVYPMQSHKMFSTIIRIQEDNIVSDTKVIIETHVADNAIRIIEIIIKNTTKESTKQRKQC